MSSEKKRLDFFRELMDERDRRYASEIESGREAVRVALTALNERVANLNELRGIVTDQSKNLITRNEVMTMIGNLQSDLTKVEKSISESTGAATQSRENRIKFDRTTGMIIAGVGVFIAIVTFGIALLPKLLK